MRKSYNFIYPLFFAIVVVFGMLVGTKMSESNLRKNTKGNEKFNTALSYIKSAYVDKVNEPNLSESAIKGMLDELDPHSVYIPEKDLKKMNQPLEGNFEGIGIEFNILQDTIVVVSPIPGGPSEELGIQSGDKIIKVDGENVAGIGITNQDVRDELLGEKGSEVEVTVKRPGKIDPLDFTITRDKIPMHSLQASYMVDDNTGYMKFSRFSKKIMNEFRSGINDLKSEGLENLILDLRGNPGGYLNKAIEMADEFLEGDKRIVYTEGRSRPKQVYDARRPGSLEDGKLIILINEGSASASEIVSGAVQDHDRGLIIGRRSFGKGLVQESKKLPDGSAMRLTVARYYTPSGRSIQKPYEQGAEEYRKEIMERFEHGEVIHKDSIEFADSLKYETSNGRAVYGGGGIMPDIFVGIDTSGQSDYYNKLRNNSLLREFAIDYVNKNEDQIKNNYSSQKAYINNFDPRNNKVLRNFINFADRNGIDYDKTGFKKSKKVITNQLKALIGRQHWDREMLYRVTNQNDETYIKALEAMNDETFKENQIELN